MLLAHQKITWPGRRWLGLCLVVLAQVVLAEVRASPTAAPTTRARPTVATDRCADDQCHASIVNRKVMHGPTAQQKCAACHVYQDAAQHRFKLTVAANDLCASCHLLKHRTVVHAPIKGGQCTGCHDPHGSGHRLMLVADATRDLCLTCHKDTFAKKKFIHGPVAVGACILCHESHSSWQPKLLVDTPNKLCVQCHAEMAPKAQTARYTHAPVREGQCTSCHDAHASDVRYQLRDEQPKMCLACHTDTAKQLASAAVVHGAMTQKGGCSSCHNAHSSQLPKLQRTSQPEACLTCHNQPTKDAEGRKIEDIAALLKANPQQHGPIREGACSACHQPHAGGNFRLLVEPYPPQFYAPFDLQRYALCFSCHIPDLVLKNQGIGLTNFRNGEQNLHFLHVNQEKGRTCRACHEVHASRNPSHVRDAVPFGPAGWMLEINFKRTSTGGTCSPACHTARGYDHGGVARLPQPATRLAPTSRPGATP
jgi:predicted CXXCH cytochrome family protein